MVSLSYFKFTLNPANYMITFHGNINIVIKNVIYGKSPFFTSCEKNTNNPSYSRN